MPLAHVVTLLGLAADAWTAIGTWIIAVGAFGTVAVAIRAAIYTKGQLESARAQLDVMQRTREEQTRPYVVVDFREHPVSRMMIALVIENIGATPAYDVQLNFSPELKSTDDDEPGDGGSRRLYPVAESPLLTDGIPMMPPGRKIVVSFDSAPKRKRSGLPLRYDATITLKDSRGKQYSEPYVADMAHLFSLAYTEEQTVHHVARALQELVDKYKKGTDDHGRLKVWVRNEDRRDLDDRVEHTLTGEWPLAGTVTPPDWIMTIGRSPFVRAIIDALPPMKRWLHRRL